MNITMDTGLLNQFVTKVHDSLLLEGILKNVNGKNHWNILCSAMDWITVASEGLPSLELDPFDGGGIGHNHLDTLKLMQYILLVDVLSESIIQLFRILGEPNSYPLQEDKSVFKQSKLSDDKYFKHIRAAFSTHPVNLTSVDGIKNNDGERFFASWVARSRFFHDFDYCVLLYSNDPEKDGYSNLGINLADLNLYVEKRYKLLEVLSQLIDVKIEKHILFYQGQIIPHGDNLLVDINILIDENKKRFGGMSWGKGYMNDIYKDC